MKKGACIAQVVENTQNARKMDFFEVKKFILVHTSAPESQLRRNGVRLPHFNPQPAFEPLHSDLFVVTFPNQFNIPEFSVRSVTRPSVRMDARGLMRWNTIRIVLNNLIAPSISASVRDFVQYFEEHPTESMVVRIETFDRAGVVIERWAIHTRGFLNVNWSDLSYRNPDGAEIEIELQPDICILEQ